MLDTGELFFIDMKWNKWMYGEIKQFILRNYNLK